jgi:hypothetical protein
MGTTRKRTIRSQYRVLNDDSGIACESHLAALILCMSIVKYTCWFTIGDGGQRID